MELDYLKDDKEVVERDDKSSLTTAFREFIRLYDDYLRSRLERVVAFYYSANSRWIYKAACMKMLFRQQLYMLSVIYGLLVNDELFTIAAMNMLSLLEGTELEVELRELSLFVLKTVRLTEEQLTVIGYRLRTLQQHCSDTVPNNMIQRFDVLIETLNIQVPNDMTGSNYILPEDSAVIQEVEDYIKESKSFSDSRNALLKLMRSAVCDALKFVKPYTPFGVRYLILSLLPVQVYLLVFVHSLFTRNPIVCHLVMPVFSGSLREVANSPLTDVDFLIFLTDDFTFPKELYIQGLEFLASLIPGGRVSVLPRILRDLMNKLAAKYDVSLPWAPATSVEESETQVPAIEAPSTATEEQGIEELGTKPEEQSLDGSASEVEELRFDASFISEEERGTATEENQMVGPSTAIAALATATDEHEMVAPSTAITAPATSTGEQEMVALPTATDTSGTAMDGQEMVAFSTAIDKPGTSTDEQETVAVPTAIDKPGSATEEQEMVAVPTAIDKPGSATEEQEMVAVPTVIDKPGSATEEQEMVPLPTAIDKPGSATEEQEMVAVPTAIDKPGSATDEQEMVAVPTAIDKPGSATEEQEMVAVPTVIDKPGSATEEQEMVPLPTGIEEHRPEAQATDVRRSASPVLGTRSASPEADLNLVPRRAEEENWFLGFPRTDIERRRIEIDRIVLGKAPVTAEAKNKSAPPIEDQDDGPIYEVPLNVAPPRNVVDHGDDDCPFIEVPLNVAPLTYSGEIIPTSGNAYQVDSGQKVLLEVLRSRERSTTSSSSSSIAETSASRESPLTESKEHEIGTTPENKEGTIHPEKNILNNAVANLRSMSAGDITEDTTGVRVVSAASTSKESPEKKSVSRSKSAEKMDAKKRAKSMEILVSGSDERAAAKNAQSPTVSNTRLLGKPMIGDGLCDDLTPGASQDIARTESSGRSRFVQDPDLTPGGSTTKEKSVSRKSKSAEKTDAKKRAKSAEFLVSGSDESAVSKNARSPSVSNTSLLEKPMIGGGSCEDLTPGASQDVARTEFSGGSRFVQDPDLTPGASQDVPKSQSDSGRLLPEKSSHSRGRPKKSSDSPEKPAAVPIIQRLTRSTARTFETQYSLRSKTGVKGRRSKSLGPQISRGQTTSRSPVKSPMRNQSEKPAPAKDSVRHEFPRLDPNTPNRPLKSKAKSLADIVSKLQMSVDTNPKIQQNRDRLEEKPVSAKESSSHTQSLDSTARMMSKPILSPVDSTPLSTNSNSLNQSASQQKPESFKQSSRLTQSLDSTASIMSKPQSSGVDSTPLTTNSNSLSQSGSRQKQSSKHTSRLTQSQDSATTLSMTSTSSAVDSTPLSTNSNSLNQSRSRQKPESSKQSSRLTQSQDSATTLSMTSTSSAVDSTSVSTNSNSLNQSRSRPNPESSRLSALLTQHLDSTETIPLRTHQSSSSAVSLTPLSSNLNSLNQSRSRQNPDASRLSTRLTQSLDLASALALRRSQLSPGVSTPLSTYFSSLNQSRSRQNPESSNQSTRLIQRPSSTATSRMAHPQVAAVNSTALITYLNPINQSRSQKKTESSRQLARLTQSVDSAPTITLSTNKRQSTAVDSTPLCTNLNSLNQSRSRQKSESSEQSTRPTQSQDSETSILLFKSDPQTSAGDTNPANKNLHSQSQLRSRQKSESSEQSTRPTQSRDSETSKSRSRQKSESSEQSTRPTQSQDPQTSADDTNAANKNLHSQSQSRSRQKSESSEQSTKPTQSQDSVTSTLLCTSNPQTSAGDTNPTYLPTGADHQRELTSSLIQRFSQTRLDLNALNDIKKQKAREDPTTCTAGCRSPIRRRPRTTKQLKVPQTKRKLPEDSETEKASQVEKRLAESNETDRVPQPVPGPSHGNQGEKVPQPVAGPSHENQGEKTVKKSQEESPATSRPRVLKRYPPPQVEENLTEEQRKIVKDCSVVMVRLDMSLYSSLQSQNKNDKEDKEDASKQPVAPKKRGRPIKNKKGPPEAVKTKTQSKKEKEDEAGASKEAVSPKKRGRPCKEHTVGSEPPDSPPVPLIVGEVFTLQEEGEIEPLPLATGVAEYFDGSLGCTPVVGDAKTLSKQTGEPVPLNDATTTKRDTSPMTSAVPTIVQVYGGMSAESCPSVESSQQPKPANEQIPSQTPLTTPKKKDIKVLRKQVGEPEPSSDATTSKRDASPMASPVPTIVQVYGGMSAESSPPVDPSQPPKPANEQIPSKTPLTTPKNRDSKSLRKQAGEPVPSSDPTTTKCDASPMTSAVPTIVQIYSGMRAESSLSVDSSRQPKPMKQIPSQIPLMSPNKGGSKRLRKQAGDSVPSSDPTTTKCDASPMTSTVPTIVQVYGEMRAESSLSVDSSQQPKVANGQILSQTPRMTPKKGDSKLLRKQTGEPVPSSDATTTQHDAIPMTSVVPTVVQVNGGMSAEVDSSQPPKPSNEQIPSQTPPKTPKKRDTEASNSQASTFHSNESLSASGAAAGKGSTKPEKEVQADVVTSPPLSKASDAKSPVKTPMKLRGKVASSSPTYILHGIQSLSASGPSASKTSAEPETDTNGDVATSPPSSIDNDVKSPLGGRSPMKPKGNVAAKSTSEPLPFKKLSSGKSTENNSKSLTRVVPDTSKTSSDMKPVGSSDYTVSVNESPVTNNDAKKDECKVAAKSTSEPLPFKKLSSGKSAENNSKSLTRVVPDTSKTSSDMKPVGSSDYTVSVNESPVTNNDAKKDECKVGAGSTNQPSSPKELSLGKSVEKISGSRTRVVPGTTVASNDGKPVVTTDAAVSVSQTPPTTPKKSDTKVSGKSAIQPLSPCRSSPRKVSTHPQTAQAEAAPSPSAPKESDVKSPTTEKALKKPKIKPISEHTALPVRVSDTKTTKRPPVPQTLALQTTTLNGGICAEDSMMLDTSQVPNSLSKEVQSRVPRTPTAPKKDSKVSGRSAIQPLSPCRSSPRKGSAQLQTAQAEAAPRPLVPKESDIKSPATEKSLKKPKIKVEPKSPTPPSPKKDRKSDKTVERSAKAQAAGSEAAAASSDVKPVGSSDGAVSVYESTVKIKDEKKDDKTKMRRRSGSPLHRSSSKGHTSESKRSRSEGKHRTSAPTTKRERSPDVLSPKSRREKHMPHGARTARKDHDKVREKIIPSPESSEESVTVTASSSETIKISFKVPRKDVSTSDGSSKESGKKRTETVTASSSEEIKISVKRFEKKVTASNHSSKEKQRGSSERIPKDEAPKNTDEVEEMLAKMMESPGSKKDSSSTCPRTSAVLPQSPRPSPATASALVEILASPSLSSKSRSSRQTSTDRAAPTAPKQTSHTTPTNPPNQPPKQRKRSLPKKRPQDRIYQQKAPRLEELLKQGSHELLAKKRRKESDSRRDAGVQAASTKADTQPSAPGRTIASPSFSEAYQRLISEGIVDDPYEFSDNDNVESIPSEDEVSDEEDMAPDDTIKQLCMMYRPSGGAAQSAETSDAAPNATVKQSQEPQLTVDENTQVVIEETPGTQLAGDQNAEKTYITIPTMDNSIQTETITYTDVNNQNVAFSEPPNSQVQFSEATVIATNDQGLPMEDTITFIQVPETSGPENTSTNPGQSNILYMMVNTEEPGTYELAQTEMTYVINQPPTPATEPQAVTYVVDQPSPSTVEPAQMTYLINQPPTLTTEPPTVTYVINQSPTAATEPQAMTYVINQPPTLTTEPPAMTYVINQAPPSTSEPPTMTYVIEQSPTSASEPQVIEQEVVKEVGVTTEDNTYVIEQVGEEVGGATEDDSCVVEDSSSFTPVPMPITSSHSSSFLIPQPVNDGGSRGGIKRHTQDFSAGSQHSSAKRGRRGNGRGVGTSSSLSRSDERDRKYTRYPKEFISVDPSLPRPKALLNDLLIEAAKEGENLQKIRSLIKEGAEVNGTNSSAQLRTPLHFAVQGNSADAVSVFLDNGADVNAKDSDSFTPLHIAAKRGYKRVMKLLIWHGASVDAESRWGSTPLQLACEFAEPEVVEYLLLSGANINHIDSDGTSVFISAKENPRSGEILALLEKYQNVAFAE